MYTNAQKPCGTVNSWYTHARKMYTNRVKVRPVLCFDVYTRVSGIVARLTPGPLSHAFGQAPAGNVRGAAGCFSQG
jgi:hypothetical protein